MQVLNKCSLMYTLTTSRGNNNNCYGMLGRECPGVWISETKKPGLNLELTTYFVMLVKSHISQLPHLDNRSGGRRGNDNGHATHLA